MGKQSRKYIKLGGCCALALSLIIGAMTVIAPARAAGPITVTTTGDVIASDGLCSLREAIIAANTDSAVSDCPAGSGADTILFSPTLSQPAVFGLTRTGANEDSAQTGDLDLIGTVAISGASAGSIIIDGNGTDRVFEVLAGAHVAISGVTIQHGNPGLVNDGGGVKVWGTLIISDSVVQANQGGGLSNNGGSMTVSEVTVADNPGGFGIYNQNQAALTVTGGQVRGNRGGIYNATSWATLTGLSIISNTTGGGVQNSGASLSHLTMNQVVIMSNTAISGGGISNQGVSAIVDLHQARVSGNIATTAGGGIFNNGLMTVAESTIDHNRARSGGGIEHFGGNLHLVNDTLSNNVVNDNGGGFYNLSNAILNNVTFNLNTANGSGGNIFNDEAQLAIANTIVANAPAGGNCVNSNGFLNSLGYNLDSGNTCGFSAAGDIINTDPLLGPLQDNGGPTWTEALLIGSPAIDQGDPATPGSGGNACPAADQRGVSRPQGNACDIGAYEYGELSAAPGNIQASDGTYPDRVRVTWEAVTGAVSYRVSRATSLVGARVVLTTTTDLAYEDTGVTTGVTYYYWVAASTGSGYGADSAPDSGFAAAQPPPVLINGVTISGPGAGSVGNAYSFMAAVEPATLTAVLPLSYTWQATGQTEVVRAGGLSDSITYTWTLSGPKLLTVTVTEWYTTGPGSGVISAAVSDTHLITITAEVPDEHHLYLPVVLK